MRSNLVYAGVVFAIVVVIILLSFWGSAAAHKTPKPSATFQQRLRGLVSEAQRWSSASLAPTENPAAAVVHATYGSAYLNVARSLASDADIDAACNLRVTEVAETLQEAQHAALKTLARACPSVALPGLAALNSGWLAQL